MNLRMQQRRDTSSDLLAKDEIPLAGEMVIETDTGKFKFGDGVKKYSELDYARAEVPGLGSETWTIVLDDEAGTTIEKKVALWS